MNGRVVAIAGYRGTPRLRSAVEAFFSDKQLSANSRRAYRQALSAVIETLGWDLPVDQLDSLKSWWSSKDSGVRRSPPGTPGSPLSSRSFPTGEALAGWGFQFPVCCEVWGKTKRGVAYGMHQAVGVSPSGGGTVRDRRDCSFPLAGRFLSRRAPPISGSRR